MTTPSDFTSSITAEFLLRELMMHNVAAWVHLAILILGLITNPLILIVLRKKKIGSEFYMYINTIPIPYLVENTNYDDLMRAKIPS